MAMKEKETYLRHGIHTVDQATARFNKLCRKLGAEERAGRSGDDLIAEMMPIYRYLRNNIPSWTPHVRLPTDTRPR